MLHTCGFIAGQTTTHSYDPLTDISLPCHTLDDTKSVLMISQSLIAVSRCLSVFIINVHLNSITIDELIQIVGSVVAAEPIDGTSSCLHLSAHSPLIIPVGWSC